MRRRRFLGACAVVWAFNLGVSAPAWCNTRRPEVQDFVPDARGAAMGNAFTAVAEGPSAIWWNPGGLGLVRGWWAGPLSVTVPEPFSADLEFRAWSICGRLGRGGAAVQYSRLTLSNQPFPDVTEHALAVGYGFDLAEAMRHRSDPRVRWGLGGSVRRFSIHAPGAVESEWMDVNAWDLDLGTILRLERQLPDLPVLPISAAGAEPLESFVAGRAGAALSNVLNSRIEPNNHPLGRVVRYGVGVESGLIPTPPFNHLLGMLVTLEVEHSFDQTNVPSDLKMGVELAVLGTLSWRYGEFDDHYRYEMHSGDVTEMSSGNLRGITQGIGLRLGGDRASISLDYARTLQGTADAKLYTVSGHWAP